MHCPDIYDISIVNIDIQIGNVKAACRLQPVAFCLIAFLKKLCIHCVYMQRTANSERRTASSERRTASSASRYSFPAASNTSSRAPAMMR